MSLRINIVVDFMNVFFHLISPGTLATDKTGEEGNIEHNSENVQQREAPPEHHRSSSSHQQLSSVLIVASLLTVIRTLTDVRTFR